MQLKGSSIRINRIRRERVQLIFSCGMTENVTPGLFVLFDEKGRGAAALKVKQTGDGAFDLILNLADAGDGTMLPSGRYRIAALHESRGTAPEGSYIAADDGICGYKESLIYGRKGFSVDLAAEADENGSLVLSVTDTAGPVLYSPADPRTAAKEAVFRNWYRMCRLKHDSYRGKPAVLFYTEQSETLTENLRILKEALEKRNEEGRFRIMTSARMAVTDQHLGMKSWLDMLAKLAEADYIFMDDHAPVLDRLKLSGDTVITQVWHGGLGFKATGYSRYGRPGASPPFSCHRQYTWGIAPSEALIPVFAEMWGIPACRVLPFGMPRLQLIPGAEEQAERKAALCRRFPGLAGRKIILFAPTYRGGSQKTAHYPFDRIDFDALAHFCGETYAVVFRMHPWITEPVPVEGYDNLFDLPAEDNMDLFSAADLMITDYSSTIYEFSLFRKPMVFYAFDAADYEEERGFHLDYREAAPGPVAESFEELLEVLKSGQYEEEKAERYRQTAFGGTAGNSADKILDAVLFGKMPQDITDGVQRNEKKMKMIRSLRDDRIVPPGAGIA